MHTDTPFDAELRHEPGRILCALSGRLTYKSYNRFRPLIEAVESHGAHEMVLDLGKLHFLDSNGLGMLLVLKDRAVAAGRRMRLVNVHPRVDRVLKHTRTEAVFGVA